MVHAKLMIINFPSLKWVLICESLNQHAKHTGAIQTFYTSHSSQQLVHNCFSQTAFSFLIVAFS
jgi:hypothetical protein